MKINIKRTNNTWTLDTDNSCRDTRQFIYNHKILLVQINNFPNLNDVMAG